MGDLSSLTTTALSPSCTTDHLPLPGAAQSSLPLPRKRTAVCSEATHQEMNTACGHLWRVMLATIWPFLRCNRHLLLQALFCKEIVVSSGVEILISIARWYKTRGTLALQEKATWHCLCCKFPSGLAEGSHSYPFATVCPYASPWHTQQCWNLPVITLPLLHFFSSSHLEALGRRLMGSLCLPMVVLPQ